METISFPVLPPQLPFCVHLLSSSFILFVFFFIFYFSYENDFCSVRSTVHTYVRQCVLPVFYNPLQTVSPYTQNDLLLLLHFTFSVLSILCSIVLQSYYRSTIISGLFRAGNINISTLILAIVVLVLQTYNFIVWKLTVVISVSFSNCSSDSLECSQVFTAFSNQSY